MHALTVLRNEFHISHFIRKISCFLILESVGPAQRVQSLSSIYAAHINYLQSTNDTLHKKIGDLEKSVNALNDTVHLLTVQLLESGTAHLQVTWDNKTLKTKYEMIQKYFEQFKTHGNETENDLKEQILQLKSAVKFILASSNKPKIIKGKNALVST